MGSAELAASAVNGGGKPYSITCAIASVPVCFLCLLPRGASACSTGPDVALAPCFGSHGVSLACLLCLPREPLTCPGRGRNRAHAGYGRGQDLDFMVFMVIEISHRHPSAPSWYYSDLHPFPTSMARVIISIQNNLKWSLKLSPSLKCIHLSALYTFRNFRNDFVLLPPLKDSQIVGIYDSDQWSQISHTHPLVMSVWVHWAWRFR